MRKAACLLLVVAVVILANRQRIQQAYQELAAPVSQQTADAPSSTPQPTRPPALAAAESAQGLHTSTKEATFAVTVPGIAGSPLRSPEARG